MNPKDVSNYVFELSQLRRIKHEGWRLIGVEHPDSVAEHSLRAAQIAFFLAHMEGYDAPDEIVRMLVFHDSGEARIGDQHKVAARYITSHEQQAIEDQTKNLQESGKIIVDGFKRMEERTEISGILAKEADLLEQAYLAKEYFERGYTTAQDWITNVGARLRTDSAKALWSSLQEMNSTDWWQGLKKIPKK